MDPINRNDPYETANPVELNAITRNDPYSGIQQAQPPARTPDAFYIFRVAGVVLGIVVVLAGVYFAGASFVIVRDILEEPQRLNAYLDEWYIPPREEPPVPEPRQNVPEPSQPVGEIPAVAPASPAPVAPSATPAPVAEAPPSPKTETNATPAPTPPLKPLVHKSSRRISDNDSPVSQAIELITDALTRGGLPRLAGALILLLLASMLIRIPFGLVKAGIELIRAMIPERTKNTP